MLDTLQLICYLAAPEEARQFLARQWTRGAGIPPLEYTPEELGRLLADPDVIPTSPRRYEQWMETLRERQANYRWMLSWLEGQSR